jgi:5-(carboxyamino)imidazole ribonucleotide mutase
MGKVCVILGSKSDQELADKAIAVLKENKVDHEVFVASAHREPDKLDKIVKESDADVFIAIAGLSAALPGVIASKTKKPVIGVPKGAKLGGVDALLSMVQMPPGVPVAVVGIDNAKNGALLAIRILSLKN